MFEHIDKIKDKDIYYGNHVILAFVGLAVLVASALVLIFYEFVKVPVEIVYGTTLILFALYLIGLFVHFVSEAKVQASLDAKKLAERYKKINDERKYYRKMRNTFNRML